MCALEDAYSKSSATPQVEHLKGRPMPSTEHGEDLEHHIHGGGGVISGGLTLSSPVVLNLPKTVM